jgi:hypothetical protein
MPENVVTISTRQTTSPIAGATEINEALSIELGETVRNMDPQWVKFANEGLVVDLHCRRERYKMTLSTDDLGIEGATAKETSEIKRILAPGFVYLLPWDAIKDGDTLDSRARGTLQRHAFRTFWGYWIHRSKYAAWREDIDRVKVDYLAVVEKILANYEKHRADALIGWAGICNQTYNRLAQTAASRRIRGFSDREAWMERQMAAMISRIPSEEEIRASYQLDWEVYRLPLLAEIEQDRANANDLRLSEAERLMLADVEATAKRTIQGGVEQFMSEVKGQVETALCEVAEACLRALNKEGKIGRNSTVQIQNLIDANRSAVFWKDESLEQCMRRLQAIIDTPPKQRNPEALRETFVQVGARARLTLAELERPAVRSAVDVGIPDSLDELQEIARRGTARTVDEILDDLDDVQPTVRNGQGRRAIQDAL